MQLFVSKLCVAWALLCFGVSIKAQSPPASSVAGSGEFFSGFVLAFSATEVTVNRKGLGKETAAIRTFQIDPATKMEGVLKIKAHVTVRFVSSESGTRAVHIIVR